MTAMRAILAPLILAAAAVYCAGDEGADLPSAPGTQQSITVTRLAPGSGPLTEQSGMTDSARLVIRDASVWAETWARISTVRPAPPLPAVDFTREMVIVAALGTRPSGGYGIVVESASRENGSLYVAIRSESPGTSCLSSAVLTAPVDVARVPRSDEQVQFRERSVTRSC
jgi:protease stability complex PrcB-like protein